MDMRQPQVIYTPLSDTQPSDTQPSDTPLSNTPPSDMPLETRYSAVRAHTLALAAPLSDEDCGAQSMPDASPVKWHMAHTTWFFETFILERMEPDFAPFHPAFRVLFNS